MPKKINSKQKRNVLEKMLEIQAMRDYLLWSLEEMHISIKQRSNIEVMIDKATGFEKEQIIKAKKAMRNIERLQRLYYLIKDNDNEKDK